VYNSSPNYGYNASGITYGPVDVAMGLGGGVFAKTAQSFPTLETDVKAPADMIALGDNFSRSRNAALDGLIGNAIIGPASHYASASTYDSKTPPKKQPSFLKHRARANRAFVDGHLEVEDMRKTFKASDGELRRWNVDNLPHQELLRD
ncbi:MAG TPA: hypothetical protein VHH73_20550, partial [Verrucomicrobiae bacterium]|nr:hypothetical protein [Verrucomicrobiae bacterium]